MGPCGLAQGNLSHGGPRAGPPVLRAGPQSQPSEAAVNLPPALPILPPPEEMPEIAGIFVGGCVERGPGSRFRAWAHAHCRRGDPFFGWVCFLSFKRVLNGRGEPGRTLWHEYAHVLTPNHGHDDTWRKKMKELGQPLPARYKKRRRG